MSLSDRIRPNSEAAPWVIEEVKRLEALLKHLADFPMHEFQYRHRDETPIYGFNGWVLTVGQIKEAKKMLSSPACPGASDEELDVYRNSNLYASPQ